MPDGLVSLDDSVATDPLAVGSKSAALARARHAGLPVLPGYVVPVPASREAVRAGSRALAERGVGAARPAVLGVGVDGEADLVEAVRRLGGRVIVRSSSPLEADQRWSGAFSSVGEVGPEDAATAVRACWASAFAPDVLERAADCGVEPEALALGVLIQPELRPSAGGLARVVGDHVQVTKVDGHPGELLSGWVPGSTSWVPGGSERDAEVAALALRVAELLGHDTIEWAIDDCLYLLQSSAGPVAPAHGDVEEITPSATTEMLKTSRSAMGISAPDHGWRLAGTPAVAGDAVGRLRYVRPHEPAPRGEPGILVCDRPIPALAPLLFGARGLVTAGGPVDCHLIEVARAIGVPVLAQVAVHRLVSPLDRLNDARPLAAIDGHQGELVIFIGPGVPRRPSGSTPRHEGMSVADH